MSKLPADVLLAVQVPVKHRPEFERDMLELLSLEFEDKAGNLVR